MASLSDQLSVVSQGLSLHSQQISVLSQGVSVLSQAVSVLSQAHSVLSQAHSVLSAGLGGVQLKAVTNAQNLTGHSAFTNVSGLSVSVTSAATYEIVGKVIFTVSAAAAVETWGFTYPTGITAGAMDMETVTSVLIGGTGDGYLSTVLERGYINNTAMSTVATAQLSTAYGSSAQTYLLDIRGLLVIGATAGTVQLQVKGAAAPVAMTVLAGSFLRAYKVT